jgi:hypothetical protein
MTFLREIARELLATHGQQLHTVGLVFPSRRAGIHFRAALQAELTEPTFAPRIYTLNDWIYRHSTLEPVDPVRLLFRLYRHYRELLPQRDEGFTSFSSWGQGLLRDFAEVDNYLLDADDVFRFLNQEKAIELWQPDRGELSEYEQNFLNFYRELGSLYHRLRQELEAERKVYPALAARLLAEQIHEHPLLEAPEQWWFCGFNALNSAENRIFTVLSKAGKAQIRWDADGYYVDRDQHEAGLFMRRHRENEALWGNYTPPQHWLQAKTIDLVQCPGTVAQVKAAAAQLEAWHAADTTLEHTLVLLADEQLLVPMLNSLPKGIEQVNITMGYPTRLGQGATLVGLLLKLLGNRSFDKSGQPIYRYHELMPLLGLPLLQRRQFSELQNQLIESRRVRLPYAVLEAALTKELPALATLLGHTTLTAGEFPSAVVPLLEQLADQKGTDALQQQLCLQLISLLRRMEGLLADTDSGDDWVLLRRLWQSLSSQESLDFLGEPLEGLQLMGLLETRALDFERILIVGANEGKLPARAGVGSMLTSTVRFNFGLPGPREQEAVIAYHFYRLLQRSKEVVICWNASTDDFGAGEISRYLQQLRYEARGLPQLTLTERVFQPAFRTDSLEPLHLSVRRDARMEQLLRERLERGLAPTALSQYLDCRLKFAFAQLERLEEPDQLEEQLDARSIGNVLHHTLEAFYEPLLGQPLQIASLLERKQQLSTLFEEALAEEMKNAPTKEGLNLLIRRVCEDYLERFFAAEQQQLEAGAGSLELVASELECREALDFEGATVYIKGTIDRVDRLNGQLRITDYKTGKFDMKEVQLKSLDELAKPDNQKALQLMTYAWLYLKSHPHETDVQSGIWSFRQLNSGLGSLQLQGSNRLGRELLDDFEGLLKQWIAELLDPATQFSQTDDLKRCERCNFRSVCQR